MVKIEFQTVKLS